MRLGSTALATERVERRLAAILATDVAGYSRLMSVDEEGTHERLKAHLRGLVDPKIEEHRGNCIARLPGDGSGPDLMLYGHLDTTFTGDAREGDWQDGDENLVRGYLDRWERGDGRAAAARARSLLECASALAAIGAPPGALWFFLWEMESILAGLAEADNEEGPC